MSQQELCRLFRFTEHVDVESSASRKPFSAAVHNASWCISAAQRFKRSLVGPLNWKKVVMAVDGRKYLVFFRDDFDAVQEDILQMELRDPCAGVAPSLAGKEVEIPHSTLLWGS